MFIRTFANTSDSDEALTIFNSLFENFQPCFQNKEIMKNEAYWKMDNVHVVEANIDYVGDVTDEQFKCFLESIADKWLFFGEPVEEALASDTTEGCKFLKQNVKLINIFY